jgi:hypothetical protein
MADWFRKKSPELNNTAASPTHTLQTRRILGEGSSSATRLAAPLLRGVGARPASKVALWRSAFEASPLF